MKVSPRGVAAAAILTWCLALLAPGSPSAIMDGVPLTGLLELSVVAAVVLVLLNRENFRIVVDTIERRRPLGAILFGLALGLLAFKMALSLWVPSAGHFEVCYQHEEDRVAESAGRGCIQGMGDSPLRLRQVVERRSTTLDSIDFGPVAGDGTGISQSNWNLAFVNSTRYDRGWFPWEPEDRDIEFFPFRASFTGSLDAGEGGVVLISYLGEGRVVLAGSALDLKPSYEGVSTVEIRAAESTNDFQLDFRFSRTRTNSESSDGKYAVLRVLDANGAAVESNESFVHVIARVVLDLAFLTMSFLLLWTLRRRLLSKFSIGMVTAIAAVLVVESRLGQMTRLPLEPSVLLFSAILAASVWINRCRIGEMVVPLTLLSFRLAWVELGAMAGSTVSVDTVLVRTRGNDQLVYRALARDMLETGFLRGGEDVFYFQPGIRYVIHVLHALFGPSDAIVGALIVTTTLLTIVYLAGGFVARSQLFRISFAVGLAGLVVWWSSSHTIQTSISGLSEFGTWPILVLVSGILLRKSTSGGAALAIGGLLGLLVWIRPNQGLAALALLSCFVLISRDGRVGSWRFMVAPSVFVVVLSLMPLHNIVFGGRLKVLPGGHSNADQIGWTAILRIFDDDGARRFFLDQLSGILYLPSVLPEIYSRKLGLAFPIFLGAFIAGVVVTLTSGRAQRRLGYLSLLVLAVAGQVVPFLNYSVYRYYPVHVVGIQLTACLAGLTLLGWSATRSTLSREESPEAATSPPSA